MKANCLSENERKKKGIRINPKYYDNICIYKDRSKVDNNAIGTARNIKRNEIKHFYDNQHHRKQSIKKFQRVFAFCKHLPGLRKNYDKMMTNSDPMTKLYGVMLALLDKCALRPGTLRHTKKNSTFGIATMKSEHIDFKNECISILFPGKMKIKNSCQICNDSKLIRVLRDLNETHRHFKQKTMKLNFSPYLGKGFSAKDFRTFHANVFFIQHAHDLVNKLKNEQMNKKRTHIVNTAIDKTSKKLHNSFAVCRSKYIYPYLMTLILKNGMLIDDADIIYKNGLNKYESIFFTLLKDQFQNYY